LKVYLHVFNYFHHIVKTCGYASVSRYLIILSLHVIDHFIV